MYSVSSKNVSVEPFNRIKRTYEGKTLIKHISYECKCKFDSTTCDSVQKYNNDISHCGVKNLRGCICENGRYLKIIANDSVIASDEIISITNSVSINVANSVSTNVTSTLSKNVTRTVPINSDDKKVRYKMDCYILSTFLLVTILLFIIVFICFY